MLPWYSPALVPKLYPVFSLGEMSFLLYLYDVFFKKRQVYTTQLLTQYQSCDNSLQE